jgi:uncharacterized protein YdeI (YjbR/CyaY-like superfamily)
MTKAKIASGVAHQVPEDMKKALLSDDSLLERWNDLTPLGRNEWICWNITVKQQKTRDEHIKRTVSELKEGKRRPCCWMGCPHRNDKAVNPTQKWILAKQAKTKS